MPVQNPPILLSNRQPMDVPGGYGASGVFVGGIALLAGAGVEVAVWLHPEKAKAPLIVVYAAGFIFAWAGLLLLRRGMWELRLARRIKKESALAPGQPWRWDHPWDPGGTAPDTLRGIFQFFYFSAFLGVFLIPANWAAFQSGQGEWVIRLVTVIFDVLGVAIAFWGMVRLVGLMRYGLHRLDFDQFPFMLGKTLRVRLEKPQNIVRCQSLSATLRCVQERASMVFSGGNGPPPMECTAVYVEEKTFSPADIGLAAGAIGMQFELPEGDFSSRLLDRPPRYWHLELSGKAPGVDFSATYLLPVYAAGPAAAPTTFAAMAVQDQAVWDKLWGFAALVGFLFGIISLAIILLARRQFELWVPVTIVCWSLYAAGVIRQRRRRNEGGRVSKV